MKKTAAISAAFAIAFLSGCGNSEPTARQTKTSAQVASAIAKNKPLLAKEMSDFGLCAVVLEMTKTGPVADDCNRQVDSLGEAARRMKDDLEAARPWPEEVREIVEGTSGALDQMVRAASSEAPDRATKIFIAATQTAQELQAWKPFGA